MASRGDLCHYVFAGVFTVLLAGILRWIMREFQ